LQRGDVRARDFVEKIEDMELRKQVPSLRRRQSGHLFN